MKSQQICMAIYCQIHAKITIHIVETQRQIPRIGKAALNKPVLLSLKGEHQTGTGLVVRRMLAEMKVGFQSQSLALWGRCKISSKTKTQ